MVSSVSDGYIYTGCKDVLYGKFWCVVYFLQYDVYVHDMGGVL